MELLSFPSQSVCVMRLSLCTENSQLVARGNSHQQLLKLASQSQDGLWVTSRHLGEETL